MLLEPAEGEGDEEAVRKHASKWTDWTKRRRISIPRVTGLVHKPKRVKSEDRE